MLSWFGRLFGGNKFEHKYVFLGAEEKQYRDESAGAWRWVLYDRYSDRRDPKGELTRARHSKPVGQSTTFLAASAALLAFNGDFMELMVRGEKQKHLDFVNRDEGTRTGLSNWRLADGSLLSESVKYSA